MKSRSTTFWAWDHQDWCAIFGPDSRTFMRRHHRTGEHRLQLVALAYLLCHFGDLHAIGRFIRRALAYKVFGCETVDPAVDRVCAELFGWGYGASVGKRDIPNVVCSALLLNRSPILEDLSTEVLAQVRAQIGAHALAVVNRSRLARTCEPWVHR